MGRQNDIPNQTIRLAGIETESIVDGPGMRMTIFVQGCPHHCEGCQNVMTHSFNGGKRYSLSTVINGMLHERENLDGLTLSGGEPFCQVPECATLAKVAHRFGLSVWCYTGFSFEELLGYRFALPLLVETDVLVDGPFIKRLRTLELPFRGSSNQRLIDVRESLKQERVVEYAL